MQKRENLTNDNAMQMKLACCLKLPNEIQTSCNLHLLTVNDLADEKKNYKEQIDEKSFRVKEPELASLVA